jgi:hypothetical protein
MAMKKAQQVSKKVLFFSASYSPPLPGTPPHQTHREPRFLAHGFCIIAAPQTSQAPPIYWRGFLLFIRPLFGKLRVTIKSPQSPKEE